MRSKTKSENTPRQVKMETQLSINKMNKPTEWEKIFANCESNKELVSKIYKQLIQLNIEKKPPTQSKNGQKT